MLQEASSESQLDEGPCPTDFETDETWVSWGPGGKQDAILATWDKKNFCNQSYIFWVYSS